MKKLAVIPFLSVVLVFGQGGKSSTGIVGTGADLARKCSEGPPARSVDEGVTEAYANGYCFGVLTTAAEILDSDGQIHFPEGASFVQIQKIVVNYLNAHPEDWQKPASLLVKRALKQAWGS